MYKASRAPIIRGALLLVLATALGLVTRGSLALATTAPDESPGTLITDIPYSETVGTTGATANPHDPEEDCNLPKLNATVWWNFTPAIRRGYRIRAVAPDFYPMLAVFSGDTSNPAQLTCAPSLDVIPPPNTTDLTFLGEAGTTYFIELGGTTTFGGSTSHGEVALSVNELPLPANDKAQNATSVSLPFESDIQIKSSTVEPDEPHSTCLYAPEEVEALTVWYAFTPDKDTAIQVDLSSYEGYNAGAIWSGPLDKLTEVACGDPLGAYASAGKTYYIQVGETQFLPYPPLGNDIDVSIKEISVPTCPPPTIRFADASSDTASFPSVAATQPPSPEILSISGGNDSSVECLTIEFADDQAADESNNPTIVVKIDGDRDIRTGIEPFPGLCSITPLLGTDLLITAPSGPGLLAAVQQIHGAGRDPDTPAFVSREGQSISIALPIAEVGSSNFDASATAYDNQGFDCISDAGIMNFGSLVAALFGDLNCDGSITPADALSIVRNSARIHDPRDSTCAAIESALPGTYPAANAALTQGDVNCDGQVNLLDAFNLLRATVLPPAAPPLGCPPIGTPPMA